MTDDDRSGRGSFTLVELSEVSGVPARTIRFYIARGLLPPPLVGGRSACYGAEHLKAGSDSRSSESLRLFVGSMGKAADFETHEVCAACSWGHPVQTY